MISFSKASKLSKVTALIRIPIILPISTNISNFMEKIGDRDTLRILLTSNEILIGIQMVNIDRSSLQEGSRPSRCYEKYLQGQAITDNSSGCRRCGGLYCAETKDVCTFKVLPKVNLLRSFSYNGNKTRFSYLHPQLSPPPFSY